MTNETLDRAKNLRAKIDNLKQKEEQISKQLNSTDTQTEIAIGKVTLRASDISYSEFKKMYNEFLKNNLNAIAAERQKLQMEFINL